MTLKKKLSKKKLRLLNLDLKLLSQRPKEECLWKTLCERQDCLLLKTYKRSKKQKKTKRKKARNISERT